MDSGRMRRRLVIGTRHLCGESLAAWLALRRGGLDHTIEVVPLFRGESLSAMAKLSPTGTVPVLETEDGVLAGALAIVEHVASRVPELWPAPPLAALAREAGLEAYSGFPELALFLPMDMSLRFSAPGMLLRPVTRELAALRSLWARCRAASGDGPFLFGAFGAVDALMAPLAARLLTHGIPLDDDDAAYVDTLRSMPEWAEWLSAGSATAAVAPPAKPEPARTASAPLLEGERPRVRDARQARADLRVLLDEALPPLGPLPAPRRPAAVRTQDTIKLPDPDGRRRRGRPEPPR
jgi:glutathione S-transferase